MSLFDALVDDAVLSRSVMQQNYYIALRSDGVKGSGTFDDPWNGGKIGGVSNFDWAMNQVPANSTVFLGPAKFVDVNGNPTTTPTEVFETKGYPTTDGYAAKSGQRVVGAGRDVTFIKLMNHEASKLSSAVGMPFKSGDARYGTAEHFLNSFELSDLTIDANLPAGTSYSAGAVNVTGKHVLVTRVRVKNYGSNMSGLDCTVISPARASFDCPVPPYNCVIDDCVVDPPSAQHNQRAIAFALLSVSSGGVMYYHDVCVVRNNYLNGGYISTSGPDVVAFSAVGARGSVIEENRVTNCKYGGPHYQASMGASIEDLIVRDNVYSNVRYGIHFTDSDAARVIVEDNLFDVFPDASAYGMLLSGVTSTTSLLVLVVRGNRVRGIGDQSLMSGAYGIYVTNTNSATIENNVVDSLPTNSVEALRITDCGSVHVFNNLRIKGDLARVLNTNSGLYLHELTTDAENVLLSL